MTATRERKRLLLASALIAGAAVLWFTTGPAGHAASANQTQGMAAAVNKKISWGSAGSCTESMGVADFGSIDPGSSTESTTFTGCVSSNGGWGVTAQGTATLQETTTGTLLGNSNIVIRTIASGLPAGATTSCDDTNTTCTLDASRSAIDSGSASPGNGRAVDFKYQLSVPAAQEAGTYTGGVVTFTASN